ncbi:nitronate monooxygenase [Couchioplanes caeruleus]|uniref:Propionate 3-nitronate monooxygenase n=2 Tax=Couchioplanes caeruleus TaxID=56438 RepID=A0A1K0GPC9_9ACTN|nr:nitronate monooxygenase [Couchioplanes caeruleus]OJF11083.1 2-nitropropane dioxygenase [Couchioplanes caeruleus subsp. caeruleus]ROP33706.1 nitroalkane oxidase [Couchioplanes caeruleus]
MVWEFRRPVVVAPMAGGPSMPGLVTAAAAAGALGFLAAGYKSADQVAREVAEVRASGVPFGLNIFVPSPPPVDVATLREYREALRPEAERYEVELPQLRLADDDGFAAKVQVAVGASVPWVSFTFGVPEESVVKELRRAGCTVLVTVTDADEARRAAAAGPDALIAQAGSAGGHSATMSPADYDGSSTAPEVVRDVRAAVNLPIIAAGGTGTAQDVRHLLAAGAMAVQAGTVFLLADEAGTRAVQRDAMLSRRFTETTVTRAFTGQPARALKNRFTDTYSPSAPLGYPTVHHLTAPIRAAATRHGDPDTINLWAGTAHAEARPGPTAEIMRRLTGED